MTGGGPDAPDLPRYHLRLFIAGSTPRSRRAIANLRRICETHIGSNVDIEVIDIYQQPELAEANRVVAAPTLLRLAPLPQRQIIGDLSDESRVLRGFGIIPSHEPSDEHGD